MATYIELQKQIEALQKEAAALKASERKDVIERMKEAITAYDITAKELGLAVGRSGSGLGKAQDSRTSRSAKARRSGAVAYADADGNTWGGLGKRPNWLREALANGRKIEEFRALNR